MARNMPLKTSHINASTWLADTTSLVNILRDHLAPLAIATREQSEEFGEVNWKIVHQVIERLKVFRATIDQIIYNLEN